MVGDLKYGRTVRSLIKLMALYKNVKFSLVSPRLEMPATSLSRQAATATSRNEIYSLAEGLAGADVIYATRVQKKRFANEERRLHARLQINRAITSMRIAAKPS